MYATVMVCWFALGCLLATSPDNPYLNPNDCDTEVVRMVEALSSPPWFPYGPPEELFSRCLSETDYNHMLEEEK